MEVNGYLKNLLRLDDFMASIDLSDASFSIPLHKDIKEFCSPESKENKYKSKIINKCEISVSHPLKYLPILRNQSFHILNLELLKYPPIWTIFLFVRSLKIFRLR